MSVESHEKKKVLLSLLAPLKIKPKQKYQSGHMMKVKENWDLLLFVLNFAFDLCFQLQN